MSEKNEQHWEEKFGESTSMIYDQMLNCEIKLEDIFKEIKGDHTGNTSYNYRFDKKLAEAILRAGYTGPADDIQQMALFLKKRLSAIGDTTDGQTIRGWLKAEHFPKESKISRIRAQNICFALGMNLEQATNFMENVLFAWPFNFRNPFECISFFALNNGLDRNHVTEIEERIKAKRARYKSSGKLESVEIRGGLKELNTEKELEAYILENVPDEAESLQTAKEEFRKLKDKALEYAKKEAESYDAGSCSNSYKNFKGKHNDSTKFLLDVIYYGCGIVRSKKIKEKMKKHALDLVVINFPLEQEFSVMLSDDKEPSADMLRKGIILLMFYNTFSEPFNAKTGIEHLEGFVEQTNFMLDKCTLPELHPRNPYDRIFIYSAYYDKDEEVEEDDDKNASIYLNHFRDIIDMLVAKDENENS